MKFSLIFLVVIFGANRFQNFPQFSHAKFVRNGAASFQASNSVRTGHMTGYHVINVDSDDSSDGGDQQSSKFALFTKNRKYFDTSVSFQRFLQFAETATMRENQGSRIYYFVKSGVEPDPNLLVKIRNLTIVYIFILFVFLSLFLFCVISSIFFLLSYIKRSLLLVFKDDEEVCEYEATAKDLVPKRGYFENPSEIIPVYFL